MWTGFFRCCSLCSARIHHHLLPPPPHSQRMYKKMSVVMLRNGAAADGIHGNLNSQNMRRTKIRMKLWAINQWINQSKLQSPGKQAAHLVRASTSILKLHCEDLDCLNILSHCCLPFPGTLDARIWTGIGLPVPDPPQLLQVVEPEPPQLLHPTSLSDHLVHRQGTFLVPLQVAQRP